MTLDEEIKLAIADNQDLPEHFVQEVISAIHEISNKADLQDTLLHIFRKSFFIDNNVPIPKSIEYQRNALKRIKPGDWIMDAGLQLDLQEFFGSDSAMFEWLMTPHPELNGERPGEFCTRNINGSIRVEAILNEMKLEQLNNKK
ncbi:MAG: MbcA/ParS/Xre antitoxin family protein [Neptuniibacter sp.]